MSSFTYYTEDERKLVREGGIPAIREVLFGSDNDKKRSLLLCLDWFMDPYYGQDISSFKDELVTLLETLIVSPNPIEVKDDALQLLTSYCWGPFKILEENYDNLEEQLKPEIKYAINMHREAQIQSLFVSECMRIWKEHLAAHKEVADRVWILFDRNTNTGNKPCLDAFSLLENGEMRHDQPYPGKAPVKVDRNGFFKEPEIKYNIILDEKKCVLTYAFSRTLSGGIFYEILGEEDNYSIKIVMEENN